MAEDKKQKKQGQINIELDEKVAEGTYSNLAIINHSVSEFVVDFVMLHNFVTSLVQYFLYLFLNLGF